MATPISEEHITKICADLTRTLALAIKSGSFPPEQLSSSCKEIYTLLDTATTIEEVITTLTDMSNRNPLYTPVLETVKKQQEAGINVEQMFQRNVPRMKTE